MGLIGHTFPRMKVSPSADALLYHSLLDGNDRIIKGYKDELKVIATGLNTYVGTGACIIQGRMIENDEEAQVTVSANDSGFICIVIDLTQTNTSTGVSGTPDYNPINNQIRLEVVKELVQQDLHNGGQLFTFPLASFVSNGTTVSLKKINHNQRIVESGSNANGDWIKFADGTMECRRWGLDTSSPLNTASGSLFRSQSTKWTYPEKFIGTPSVVAHVIGNTPYSWASNGLTDADNISATFTTFSTTSHSLPSKVSLIAKGRWK